MPIKNNCLLCNNLLVSTEEKKFGTHYHCSTNHLLPSDYAKLDNDKPISAVKTNFVLILYNSLVLLLFAVVIFTQII